MPLFNEAADIQAKNCLIGLDNTSVLEYFEKKESEKPVPRKLLGDRTIYLSRQLRLTHGLPVICDLGEARLGDEEHSEDIMPDLYRAPEVILGMKWSYPVDMWSMALTVSRTWPVSKKPRVRVPRWNTDTSRPGTFLDSISFSRLSILRSNWTMPTISRK